MAWGTPSRERRVLKAGHSSIAVTLPKPWAEAMNLRPGDLVVFDQNDDGTLFLKPAPAPGTVGTASPFLVQARSIDTPGLLERLIVGAYRVGHDAIEVRTDVPLSADRMEELTQTARGLLGVSIVAQEPNRVVLQNFIDPSKYGLPQLVQRMKMILVAFLEEMEEVVRRRGRSRRLSNLEEEANKVLALLVRQLFLASRDWSLARRIGSPDPRQLLEWRVVVHSLEELSALLGEALAALNDEAPRLTAEAAAALARTLPDVKGQLKSVVDTVMHPSLDHACEVYQQGDVPGNGGSSSAWSISGGRSGRSRATSHLLKRSSTCLTLLAGLAIDRAVAAGGESVLTELA
ncbi:MAG TPA: AbrB/MazE/SpoVT family DNA-binding domain-containing protein [Thermoplasmata archaeon]|nr:AbrB/MazE/SpoVT family DNA-binding domain-containing protein [Thermoplasmata archaeon]